MSWGVAGVSVRFGDTVALDVVTFDVERGQIAVVVGGDGAGKTTLCRAISGLVAVESGKVFRPDRTCYQPETSGVWLDLTVLENLQFIAGAYDLHRAHADRRIDELLEVTDLAAANDRLGRHLSGGMRQRLGVAMAVLSEPDLLVLDEPTTGLDPVSRLELWSFINRSAQEGRAVIVTTTYVNEASRGGAVLALDEGRVLSQGTVDDVLAAMPGRLYESPRNLGDNSWRRGDSWRFWSGDPMPGLTEIVPDLADVVTVAALVGDRR